MDEAGGADRLDDELGDPITAGEPYGGVPIGVHHADLDLPAIARVHRAWSIDDADAVPGREAGPRMDEGGVTGRQSDRDAGADQPALPRSEFEVLGGLQVGAGVAGVGIGRGSIPGSSCTILTSTAAGDSSITRRA